MTEQKDPNAVQHNPPTSAPPSTTSKVDGEISGNGGSSGGWGQKIRYPNPPDASGGWEQKIRYPNPPDASGGWEQKIRYPNPPDVTNPDSTILRDQWRFATRQYSKWFSRAWGTAILAGVSLFAVGWFIKGSNPLPSKQDEHPPPSPSAAEDR